MKQGRLKRDYDLFKELSSTLIKGGCGTTLVITSSTLNTNVLWYLYRICVVVPVLPVYLRASASHSLKQPVKFPPPMLKSTHHYFSHIPSAQWFPNITIVADLILYSFHSYLNSSSSFPSDVSGFPIAPAAPPLALVFPWLGRLAQDHAFLTGFRRDEIRYARRASTLEAVNTGRGCGALSPPVSSQ